jgi:hypothetical protein
MKHADDPTGLRFWRLLFYILREGISYSWKRRHERKVYQIADPKLDIEKRLDRIELAIVTMATRLSIDKLTLVDADEIEKILRREIPIEEADAKT